jgi:subtilisin family serine protease
MFFVYNFFIGLYPKEPREYNDFSERFDKLSISKSESDKYILYFEESSFQNNILLDFISYGGKVGYVWNNSFTSFCGFSGKMENETKLIDLISMYPNMKIEADGLISTQMNYAGLQSNIFNETWFNEGLKGNMNASTVILDTGIALESPYFPLGYNSTNFSGNVIAWNDYINGNITPYDDNGHGTFISSVIAGTGSYSYNSTVPIQLNLYGNYSHSDLFDNNYLVTQNYSFKISSFNISKSNSYLKTKATWDLFNEGINQFGIKLFKNNTLINSSFSEVPGSSLNSNFDLSLSGNGIYDVFIEYEHQALTDPIFNFTLNLEFYPEFFIKNYSYFTGIVNASKLVVYKTLNESGYGFKSELIQALGDIIKNKFEYHIISVCLSLGGKGEFSNAMDIIIDEIIENGIMVIIAAGNYGITGVSPLNSLAINKNAIVVGAINDDDQLTSYSSMGKELENGIIRPDLLAPGGSSNPNHREIISADSQSDGSTSSYGTSIAAAIVTGAFNLLVESKWKNWNTWINHDTSSLVKLIKSILLMTASETNQNREDDYFTNTIDESLERYSPTRSLLPLSNGIKDVQEGYGCLNFQAARDALTNYIVVNSTSESYLTSSLENPLKNHVYARRINLTKNTQYKFNISYNDEDADLELFLFSQNCQNNGEPKLLQASRKVNGNNNEFYFIPKKNETNCIIVVKAIQGKSAFNLSVNTVLNEFSPELKVPEISYTIGQKNTTVMSFREYNGQDPIENSTFDSYRFYIEYFDNDTSNIPPQEVYLSITGKSKNFSMSQTDLFDSNFSNGVTFQTEYINLYESKIYQYFFVGSDGNYRFQTQKFNLSVVNPSNEREFPYNHTFNEGLDNWTIKGTGWKILHQNNSVDNKSGINGNTWNAIYFGTYFDYPKNYTYQPIAYGEDSFPNGSLISPIFDLINIDNFSIPFVEIGLRVSIHAGDFMYLKINANGTGWTTLETYSNIERDWDMERINISNYIGNYIQFRFFTSLDEDFDPINYKGIIIDSFSLSNYSNNFSPQFLDYTGYNSDNYSTFEYNQFQFSLEYFDEDNNYPEFVFIEIGEQNHTMINNKGDWKAQDGIHFIRSLGLKYSNLSFKFHVSDGKFIKSTELINGKDDVFNLVNPLPLNFSLNKDGKFIGYSFSNISMEDYFIAGNPIPKENTPWLQADNSWHHVTRLGRDYLYGGRGLSFGSTIQGYQNDWNAHLITKPLQLEDNYKVYLKYDFDISLQNELNLTSDLDKCIVSISTNYGDTWTKLKQYLFNDEILSGTAKIDISDYSSQTVMIRFTVYSNDISVGVGYGWLISDLYVGYEKTTDFIDPNIEIINPKHNNIVKSTIKITANITDNKEVDSSRIQLFIDNKLVSREKYIFNSTSGILSYFWNTELMNDGNHEIKIVAYDITGNKAEKLIPIKVENGPVILSRWISLILTITVSIGLIIFSYFLIRKSSKRGSKKFKEKQIERKRIEDIDKIQSFKKIEILEEDQDIFPSTLHCKYCDSWFSSKKFDLICPTCEHDQIYVAYKVEFFGRKP